MKNKNLILGIAAGVAALAVVGVVCNKKGYINFGSMLDKAGDLAGRVKNSLGKIKDSAIAGADSVIQEGRNTAEGAMSGAVASASGNNSASAAI